MAAFGWRANAIGTAATYKSLALAVRNAELAANGLTATPEVETQYAVVLAAVDAVLSAMGSPSDSFRIQIQGSQGSGPASQAQPAVIISVQRT